MATKKAPKHGDPIAPLKPRNIPASRQIKFKVNTPRKVETPAVGNARIMPNPLTGYVGVPTAIALSKKRRLGIKLPGV